MFYLVKCGSSVLSTRVTSGWLMYQFMDVTNGRRESAARILKVILYSHPRSGSLISDYAPYTGCVDVILVLRRISR